MTIADPELIKIVLVKDFNVFHNRLRNKVFHEIVELNLFNSVDDKWKKIRSIVSPTFTSGKMKKMYSLIDQCTKLCIDNFESHIALGQVVNVKDIYGCLTMDVIAKCAFGTDINAKEDSKNPFVRNAHELFELDFTTIVLINVLPAFLLKLIGIKAIVRERNNQFFFKVTREVMAKRRQDKLKFNDFLQLLMDSQEKENKEKIDKMDIQSIDAESHYVNEDSEEIKNASYKSLNGKIDDSPITDDEIVAQAWIFFLAGYETTASTLSYCTHELALNQNVQEKLYQEIKSSADRNGEIDYETLAKLPYLDAVISETLRKYPPVTRLERLVCQDNYKLANTGITLNKGDLVEIPAYAIHHSEEFYPEPEKFQPQRFLPENRHLINPYAYLPFGSGPRNCVGMRFGLLESKLALSKVILKYKFERSPNTQDPLQFYPLRRVLSVKKGVFVKILKR